MPRDFLSWLVFIKAHQSVKEMVVPRWCVVCRTWRVTNNLLRVASLRFDRVGVCAGKKKLSVLQSIIECSLCSDKASHDVMCVPSCMLSRVPVPRRGCFFF